jgi:hypothetical protein
MERLTRRAPIPCFVEAPRSGLLFTRTTEARFVARFTACLVIVIVLHMYLRKLLVALSGERGYVSNDGVVRCIELGYAHAELLSHTEHRALIDDGVVKRGAGRD